MSSVYPEVIFFNYIYFNWRLTTVQYCGGFLPYVCPPSRNHLPPHPIPLGCPSAPALSALFHASNLNWSSVSHMVIYMFQCCSLKSPHPHLLPQIPKVCSLYLCLFCCLTYGVMCSYSQGFCFTVLLKFLTWNSEL